ncbi:Iodotyrosine deiodinase 1 [Seminavis robusta]|uniref:Iodotyrosine deiodinase 1 n=1 Tax=Seminavis robusta TaxID=568900 RepID=A0A9N8HJP0_9STRA|nr:Iodotyrosine deiodinase 1 [Seminavis robusta]|eukprot:Sro874_g214270.1 Iodotyrosine deiodinase 1 (308) ;mRNA; f:35911-36834
MTNVSQSEKIALVAISSAITAVLVYRWSKTPGRNVPDEDDFVAHQGEPGAQQQKQGDGDDRHFHVPYIHQRLALWQIRRRSEKLLRNCQQRRTLRFFSNDAVPKDVISNILQTAATAPSGAHKQPWTFVAIKDPRIKQKIRAMVEEEETINYKSRMRKTWVDDLKPMMSSLHQEMAATTNGEASSSSPPPNIRIEKPYLTEAPWLIAVFKQTHGGLDPDTGKRIDHYYVQESVGIACGFLCAAIQNANLCTLTSTPMGAEKGIRELLDRPDNEKLFLLLPVGFPAAGATVPYRNPERKPSSETIVWK